MQTVLVHFDVSDNQVRLETFIKSAIAAQKSVQAINNAYFGGELVFEIVVLAPEAGSLKQFIGISWKFAKGAGKGAGYAYAILWSAIQLLDSPTVREISEELYGKKPTEIIINRLEEIKEKRQEGEVSEETLAREAQDLVEELVARSASSGLEFEPENLKYLRYQTTQSMSYLRRSLNSSLELWRTLTSLELALQKMRNFRFLGTNLRNVLFLPCVAMRSIKTKMSTFSLRVIFL